MNDVHTLIKIARLYYVENLNQQEIASKLNLSRVKVHRLLLKARDEGIVEIQINEPVLDYSQLEIRIEQNYNIKECIVVPSSNSIKDVYESMGNALSEIFERDLKDDMYIGVGWGTTLRGVAESFKFPNKIKVKVVPFIGGLGPSEEKIHANSIVSLIAGKIGGEGFVLSCPAFVKDENVKKLFMNEKIVKDVFAMAKEVQTAIVSIGYLGADMTVRKMDLMKKEELTYLQELGLIGDVNASFINKDGIGVENKIQGKIINIGLERLSEIKNVIGIAFGKKKVKVIRAALKNNLINTLITDKNTAENLL